MTDKHFFLISPGNIIDDRFSLDSNESHHAINVLRLQVGSNIWLSNGEGTVYKSKIESTSNGSASGKILKSYVDYGENSFPLHLGLGLIKGDRMKIAIEKSVECGATSINPIILDKCIVRKFNQKKHDQIVRTTVKQCGRSTIPKVQMRNSLNDWIKSLKPGLNVVCIMSGSIRLIDILTTGIKGINILVGPEGDFSQDELNLLGQNNFVFANLGVRRLRTETAVAAALSIINAK